MSRTKSKPEKFHSRTISTPVSVRFPLEQLAWIEAEAAKMGYSANRFILMALKGAQEMIETPDGQPMREPELVALARFIRKPMTGAVLTRKG